MNIRFYDAIMRVIRPVYALIWPCNVTGLENIPDEGAFILCANHIHARDPFFISIKANKRRYVYLAKSELFKSKLLARILGEKGFGSIPVKRGESDLGAIRLSMQALKDGQALGIFPQGTRSRDNTPTPMLTGVAMIAVRANVPVIPVYIDGPYRLFKKTNLSVGKPVDYSDFGRKFDSATLTAITKRIETAIWSMKQA